MDGRDIMTEVDMKAEEIESLRNEEYSDDRADRICVLQCEIETIVQSLKNARPALAHLVSLRI